MKKMKIMATVLAGVMALGMTACGTKPTETTVAPTSEVTTESTTEATPVETTEATTVETTAETSAPAQQFSPEQCLGLTPEAGFTDIDLGGATIETKDYNGVEAPLAPNYVAGQDIVITFKSDADLTITRAFKYAPDVNIQDGILQWEMMDGRDITIDMAKIVSDVTLTQTDGVYTLTIPAGVVTSDYMFYVEFSNGAVMTLRCVA